MSDIVLCTINARFKHTAFGLRYLRANLGELKERCEIVEFVLGQKTEQMLEQLLAKTPRIVGFGVYIWNVQEITALVGMLRTVAPDIKIVLGGPEISFETEQQSLFQWADHVITGQGDVSFAPLAKALLDGPKPLMKIIPGQTPDLEQLLMPYQEYSDTDLSKRLLYVEASRGCPFKCEFCLSALDKTATPFPLDNFLAQLDQLYARGARLFKFVDRTFNLNVKTSQKILDFFLNKMATAPNDPVFAHFELVPDHLPNALKETIAKFPEGSLQFELGIQTWNPEVQANISRKQKNSLAEENISWLVQQSHAHLHVDLIIGLPGETLESFGAGFDRLHALRPHEIQVGVLKRLRGTPIIRHTNEFQMRYNPLPPYNILSNRDIAFADMQRLSRFARYWDLIGNSGRFIETAPQLLGSAPFARFLAFSDWLYWRTSATHQLAIERLFDAIHEWLTEVELMDANAIENALTKDYAASGAKGRLRYMHRGVSIGNPKPQSLTKPSVTPPRQSRALRQA